MDKGDAVFFDEMRGFHLGDEPQPLQRTVGKGDERFADVVAREFFSFQDEHAVAVLSQDGGGGGAGGAAADEDGVVGFAHGVVVILGALGSRFAGY